jgi:hypothetical protein
VFPALRKNFERVRPIMEVFTHVARDE